STTSRTEGERRNDGQGPYHLRGDGAGGRSRSPARGVDHRGHRGFGTSAEELRAYAVGAGYASRQDEGLRLSDHGWRQQSDLENPRDSGGGDWMPGSGEARLREEGQRRTAAFLIRSVNIP